MTANPDVAAENLVTAPQRREDAPAAHTVLTDGLVPLPADLAAQTEVLMPTPEARLERRLHRAGLAVAARRIRSLRRGWTLFRRARKSDVVITVGYLEGQIFAALQRLLKGRRRPVHVMYDCLWYGGGRLRRAWLRFCLREVDRCIVWASVEIERYARAYNVAPEKFLFVPHHDTLHRRYTYTIGDEGYIFTGGNSDRDYGLLLAGVRDLPVACVIATSIPGVFTGLAVPPNVRTVNASPAEFRQLMARAHILVLPLNGNLLRTAGHQTFLNAMKMGKPVIVTDPSAAADYIENGKTGVLVPYGDVAALRAAIHHLLTHPQEAREMGEQARIAAGRLTPERCYFTIWRHALQLAQNRELGVGNHARA